MIEEARFNLNKFWGHEALRERVVFRRKSHMKCIYCGGIAKTREHCPSKVFVQKPRPSDLPVLPACSDCNNSYSKDEEYTFRVIDLLYKYYQEQVTTEIKINSDDKQDIIEAKKYVSKFVKGDRFFNDRMGRIFIKLAIGHAAYEITEGYYSQDWDGVPLYVTYTIRPLLSNEEWEGLEYAELISEDPLPTLGSRVFRNIYVIQLPLISTDKKTKLHIETCFMDWTDVQEDSYKYIAYLKEDKITVKYIIREFLYAEIVFRRTN